MAFPTAYLNRGYQGGTFEMGIGKMRTIINVASATDSLNLLSTLQNVSNVFNNLMDGQNSQYRSFEYSDNVKPFELTVNPADVIVDGQHVIANPSSRESLFLMDTDTISLPNAFKYLDAFNSISKNPILDSNSSKISPYIVYNPDSGTNNGVIFELRFADESGNDTTCPAGNIAIELPVTVEKKYGIEICGVQVDENGTGGQLPNITKSYTLPQDIIGSSSVNDANNLIFVANNSEEIRNAISLTILTDGMFQTIPTSADYVEKSGEKLYLKFDGLVFDEDSVAYLNFNTPQQQ